MPQVIAEPYEFGFEPSATALIVIDMQRDFVDPGGFGEALGNNVALLRQAIAPTRRVLDAARAAGMLGAIAVFIIDRNFRSATIFAGAAAVLSFFGLIHGSEVGIAVNPDIVVGYLLMGAITGFLWVTRRGEVEVEESVPQTAAAELAST